MALEILTIPCRTDNYSFILHNAQTGEVAIIDAPEAEPILKELRARQLVPTTVVLTHHHTDHVEGLPGIQREFPVMVIGAAADIRRLPKIDQTVTEGDQIELCGHSATIIDVSGHTIGHIAVHLPDSNAVFTADSLMALGCGRVFEGTYEQMWASLSKLAKLPKDTIVYSGHEYTAANAKFAMTIEPENNVLLKRIADISEKRAKGKPTVPSRLSLELDTNPFLRANSEQIRKNLQMETASDSEVFAEIRRRKDNF